jgi:hypothetical protein
MARPTGTYDDASGKKANEMIEWFLMDRNVELQFQENEKRRGMISPEFDFHFYLDGRRITQRGLAMQIVCECLRRNYRVSLPMVLAGLTELSWRYYVQQQEYPDWLVEESRPLPLRRPRGRPRVKPPTSLTPTTMRIGHSEHSVNTETISEEVAHESNSDGR